jgi:hypothetical protein
MSSDAVQQGAEIAARKKAYNYILFEDDSSEAIIPFRYTSSDTLLYTMKGSQSLQGNIEMMSTMSLPTRLSCRKVAQTEQSLALACL